MKQDEQNSLFTTTMAHTIDTPSVVKLGLMIVAVVFLSEIIKHALRK